MLTGDSLYVNFAVVAGLLTGVRRQAGHLPCLSTLRWGVVSLPWPHGRQGPHSSLDRFPKPVQSSHLVTKLMASDESRQVDGRAGYPPIRGSSAAPTNNNSRSAPT
jgi:hypothetical protein